MVKAPQIDMKVMRRLTTILVADVVGYSGLMAADEEGTLASLKTLREEIIDPAITNFHGRVVKLMGNGTLMEFGSAVDAVNFSVDIQQSISSYNLNIPQDQRITFRIGINIGDVVVEDEDIYGNGVNVAARLEGIADPGGICVSGTVVDHVKGKLSVHFLDRGKQQVKNIPQALHVFAVSFGDDTTGENKIATKPGSLVGSDQGTGPKKPDTSATDIDLTLPDSPSIAVLPFNNMSADPEQEFFSDGITEDIITALSKIRGLMVVARNSTFTYKDKCPADRCYYGSSFMGRAV
ncbi:MAG: adenylate cyclase [Parasphingorhabdus sp.]